MKNFMVLLLAVASFSLEGSQASDDVVISVTGTARIDRHMTAIPLFACMAEPCPRSIPYYALRLDVEQGENNVTQIWIYDSRIENHLGQAIAPEFLTFNPKIEDNTNVIRLQKTRIFDGDLIRIVGTGRLFEESGSGYINTLDQILPVFIEKTLDLENQN